MFHAVVSLQYDGVQEDLRLHTERTVHVWVTIGAVSVSAQHRLIIVLCALDTDTWVSLNETTNTTYVNIT